MFALSGEDHGCLLRYLHNIEIAGLAANIAAVEVRSFGVQRDAGESVPGDIPF
jgi:hypothetical protein